MEAILIFSSTLRVVAFSSLITINWLFWFHAFIDIINLIKLRAFLINMVFNKCEKMNMS